MKPSYYISRLLRPVFTAFAAISLASSISANITFAESSDDSITYSENASDSTGVSYTGITQVGDITGNYKVDYTSDSSSAYGIYNEDSAITSINASITVKSATTDSNYHSSGIETWWGEIGSIAGDITSTAVKNAYGVYNIASEIDSISTTISVTSTSANAYGLFNDYGDTGTLSSSITASAVSGYAIGVGNYWCSDITSIAESASITATGKYAYGITNEYEGSIGSVAGTIIATGTSSSYGISNAAASGDYTAASIGSINADITATTSSGKAYGISNAGDITGSVSGSISATGSSETYGIYNTGDIAGNLSASITASTTGTSSKVYGIYNTEIIGDVTDTSINVSSSSSGDSYGIYSSDTIGDIAADATVVNSGSGSAYGMNLSGTVGAVNADIIARTEGAGTVYGLYAKSANFDFSGNIDSSSASGITYGLYYYYLSAEGNVTIGEGSSISATSEGAGNAFGLYSMASSGVTINLEDGVTIQATALDESSSATAILATKDLTIQAEGTVTLSASTTGSDVSTRSIYSTNTATVGTTGTLNLIGDIQVDSGTSTTPDYAGSLTITNGTVALSEGSKVLADSITINEGGNLSLVIAGANTITASTVTIDAGGTLTLSAGSDLTESSSYTLSSAEGFTGVSNSGTITTYGGSLSGNTFIVSTKQVLTLDEESGEGVTITSDNGRVVVSSSTDALTQTTITMNFNAAADDDNTIEISSVSTVTKIAVAKTDQSFADYISINMSTDLSLNVAEAYHFEVTGLDAGDSVEVIFYVGEGYDASQITVYHLNDTDESWDDATEITNFTYDGEYLTAYVDGFSTVAFSIMSLNEDGSDTIPEPSTATLSLLALAGLCARRRRR